MNQEVIIVIDVGTSSMRCALINLAASCIWMKQVKYSPQFLSDQIAEQDPDIWLSSCINLLQAASIQIRQDRLVPLAISLTSQRSSVIPVKSDGTPLMNAIMWQDKRINPICLELERTDGEAVVALSGSKINSAFAGGKMRWIRENQPDIYERAIKLITPADYLVLHLTGEFATDHTYGSRTSLMNIRTRRWDPDLLKLYKVDEDKLCRLVEPGSMIGELTGKAAKLTELPKGLPLISAGGDQQCSALGLGVLNQSELEATAGTGGYIISASCQVPEKLDRSFICGASAVPGQYVLETTMLTCASAFDYLVRQFFNKEANPYHVADLELAEVPAGSNGIIVLPFFQGRGSPDWNMNAKGQILNLCLGSGRGSVARACLEGIACELANHIDIISAHAGSADVMMISGGLARNADFRQMIADLAQKAVRYTADYESTLFGAWMSASVNQRAYPDFKSAYAQIVRISRFSEAYPIFERRHQYEQLRNKFNQAYQECCRS